jgi:hypothetical protein
VDFEEKPNSMVWRPVLLGIAISLAEVYKGIVPTGGVAAPPGTGEVVE